MLCLQMLFEIANMLPPKDMQPQKAPVPPAKPLCVITGRPAKYRLGILLHPEAILPIMTVSGRKPAVRLLPPA